MDFQKEGAGAGMKAEWRETSGPQAGAGGGHRGKPSGAAGGRPGMEGVSGRGRQRWRRLAGAEPMCPRARHSLSRKRLD